MGPIPGNRVGPMEGNRAAMCRIISRNRSTLALFLESSASATVALLVVIVCSCVLSFLVVWPGNHQPQPVTTMTAGSAAYGRVCPTASELNSDRNLYTTNRDASSGGCGSSPRASRPHGASQGSLAWER